MNNDLIQLIVRSWANTEGNVNSIEDLLVWIQQLNKTTHVKITESRFDNGSFWYYDSLQGEILNANNSFFSIKGIQASENGHLLCEHPIIIQSEIGYLGIICKEIDGFVNFLMQAKIEPGNINCVQISPTIQATISNFTKAHGGKQPEYLDYFTESEKFSVIYDQIQSEQASRFYKKRNRNIIILIEEEIEVSLNFKWMTLGQIKKLMEIDNLVNMDTRSVLSGLPMIYSSLNVMEKEKIRGLFSDIALYRSIFETDPIEELSQIYKQMNNIKMFQEITVKIIPLYNLADWMVDRNGITCSKPSNFMVRYYDIEISGREVQRWSQPLMKAIGSATFGLITKKINGVRKFLIQLKEENGSFDMVEMGPSVQWESKHNHYNNDLVENMFLHYINVNSGIMHDTMQSEEGGRFYHEQNRNIVLEIDKDEMTVLPKEYVWVNYSTLNYLVQINNCLNIQLRNLLSLLRL